MKNFFLLLVLLLCSYSQTSLSAAKIIAAHKEGDHLKIIIQDRSSDKPVFWNKVFFKGEILGKISVAPNGSCAAVELLNGIIIKILTINAQNSFEVEELKFNPGSGYLYSALTYGTDNLLYLEITYHDVKLDPISKCHTTIKKKSFARYDIKTRTQTLCDLEVLKKLNDPLLVKFL